MFKSIWRFVFCLILFSGCSKNTEESSKKIFSKLTSSGINFQNNLTENDSLNYFTYSYMYMGGGVATGDINNDGLLDIYFTGNQVENKLYLNKGNLQFEDITKSANVGGDARWYTGVTMADVNNDGLLDIYCSVSGKFQPTENQLFINNGDHTFTEKAKAYGIADSGNIVQGTFFDYDNDGDLDLYNANYPITNFKAPNGYYQFKLTHSRDFETDHLYRNDGNTFTDVTNESGIRNFGLSLSATVGDLNNDGWQDLYISNDFSSPDFMYLNNQDGTFKEVVKKATAHTAFYGMGVDIADINNDGNLDIFQVDMDANTNRRSKANMASMNPSLFWGAINAGFQYQYMHNIMQINTGFSIDSVPSFTNASRLTGTSSTDWSWGPLFADFDNDGNKDLFISNGTRREINNRDFFNEIKKQQNNKDSLLGWVLRIPSEKIDNFMFKNKGNLDFEKVNKEWGIEFEGWSNGASYADLDNDGDLEIITNNIDDTAAVFENHSSERNNYLTVKFDSETKNKFGIGNRVYVTTENQTQMQELTISRGFQSSVAPQLHFGLGQSEKINELKVVWSDGKVEKLKHVKVNQTLVLKHNSAVVFNEIPKEKETLFQTETSGIFPKHKHQENSYDDFDTQVLLPHKMSSFGPAIAVGDLNGDNKDDYFIGASSNYQGSLYFQTENGFEKQETTIFEEDKMSEDVGVLIFDAENDGDNDLYVVSGGYEFTKESERLQDRLYLNDGKGNFAKSNIDALPKMLTSGSRAYSADFNKDGKLDILTLGRQIPKNYPTPADSYVLLNKSDENAIKFEILSPNIFKDLGMATSAIITDVDNDTWQDIIIVGEWMPIRVFKNTQTGFKEISEDMGLNQDSTGWWWSINEGDFDNDGDIDYIVGNNGLNYKYKATEDETFDIFVNDFDRNSKSDIVLSYYNQGEQYPVRGRSCSSQQIPAIKSKFKNYEEFSTATLVDVYTKKDLENALHYQVKSFASVYLENKDGKFIMHNLPVTAQFSSINQILVDDYNKDGNLDVLIAGNLYVSEVETPRNDGSYGLYLQGNGEGAFKSIPPKESGFYTPGDVKDMATIKVKNDTYIISVKNDDYLQFTRLNN